MAFTGALRVTMKVVAKPKIKKIAPKTVIPTSKWLLRFSM